ncbi:hypothetical protein EBU71_18595 [bacterium]|nr:hypothetical protein [Candidatus Elulimicrobium humile]
MNVQSTVEIHDKSKLVNGKVSTKSILVKHISCIDHDISLRNIAVGKSAWQFSVYMFGNEFIVSSEAFKPTDNVTETNHLKEIQQTLKTLLKDWNQIHNGQMSKNHIPCPN